jgi:hypothetical protein
VKEEATDEYKALAGQEKYEADKEMDDARSQQRSAEPPSRKPRT